MAQDDFPGIARKVLLRCPQAPLTLAQDWVRNSFRDIVEYRRWSWLIKFGIINIPAAYSTGFASVSTGGTTVTLSGGGTTSSDWVGRQFRISANSPILTISSITSSTVFELDPSNPWPAANASAVAYRVYQAYYFLPSDFHAFISVTAPQYTWPVSHLGVSKQDLDVMDPQRSATGTPPRVIVPYDYYNGLPRAEMWPHQTVGTYLTMTYESRPVDPFDNGSNVPTLIPSDLILERAMMYCSRWPGPTRETPNPYYSESLASFHEREYTRRLGLIIKQDNEHVQQDVKYQRSGVGLPSAAFAQSHDMNWYGR